MVAISYNKVVEQYEIMSRKYMQSFFKANFYRLFKISVGDKERCFLHDGQNCATAR